MFPRYITRRRLAAEIAAINERIDGMATQDDVNALVTQVDQVATDLASAQSTLQTEIDQLAAANPSLDLSALQAAVAPLDDHVKALAAITPTPPAAPAG